MVGRGTSVDFVFGLTYEKEGTDKINYKFRCLIIRKDELEAIGEERRKGNAHWYDDVDLEVDNNEYFRHRLRNLESLSVLYEVRAMVEARKAERKKEEKLLEQYLRQDKQKEYEDLREMREAQEAEFNRDNPDYELLCEDSKCAMIGEIKLLDRSMMDL